MLLVEPVNLGSTINVAVLGKLVNIVKYLQSCAPKESKTDHYWKRGLV